MRYQDGKETVTGLINRLGGFGRHGFSRAARALEIRGLALAISAKIHCDKDRDRDRDSDKEK